MAEPRRRKADRKRLLYPLVLWLLVVAVLAFLVFRHFLATFTVAASVAIMLAPLQRRLTATLRGRASAAAGLLVLLTTVVILVPILVSAGILSQQAVAFFEWVRPRVQPAALESLYRDVLPARYPWLHDWLRFDDQEAARTVSTVLSGTASAANRFIQGTVTGITSAIFELFLFLLFLFFLLRDGGALRAEVRGISPVSEAQEHEVVEHLERTIRGVLKAMFIVPFAQGFVAMLGFAAFGVPSPVLWGVVVVLAALIPIIGSPLGWGPAVVYLYLRGDPWLATGLLLYGIVVISGLDNVIKPLVLKGAAQIHPLPAFLSTLGGLFTFGPLGFLIGPVILSLVLSAIRIYRMDVLHVAGPEDALGASG